VFRIHAFISTILLFALIGCTSDADPKDTGSDAEAPAESNSDAEWSDLEGDGDAGDDEKEDDYEKEDDDTGKDEGQFCGDEVEAGAPCEGTWEATMCVDEAGEYWWCESGEWTSDKER
jgi:hypothetical protein